MKNKPVITLIILFNIVGLICAQRIDIHGRIFNFKGWNIPEISKLQKISVKKIKILEDIPKLLIEDYKYVYNEEQYFKQYLIVNKKILDGKNVDLREDLNTYQKEVVKKLRIFKTENGEKILCYQYEYIRDPSADELFCYYLQSLRKKTSVLIGGISGGYVSVYIADLDNDGIYESKFGAFDNEYALYAILRAKLSGIDKNAPRVDEHLIKLKKAWKRYLDYPSSDNAHKIYLLLDNPNSINAKKETKVEEEIWNWIWLTLPVLEKEIYAGERNAVKVAFKLYPIHKGEYSVNLDVILAHLARVNPKLFLEELKAHGKLITPSQAVDGSIGYEYIGLEKVRYLRLKNTFDALFKVNEPHLVETRDACLNYLKKQMDFLRKNFDIKH